MIATAAHDLLPWAILAGIALGIALMLFDNRK